MITIRPARRTDLEALARLRHALWCDARVKDHEAELVAILDGDPTLVEIVAEDADGALVGFVEVGLRSVADGCDRKQPVGYLEGWYVADEHRRGGVGARLVRAAEDWARAQGCAEMASDTWIDNLPSQRAHEALGYEVVDRVVAYRKPLRRSPLISPNEIDDRHVLIDARPGNDAYAAGHLAGAIHADLNTQLSAPNDPRVGGRHPLPSLEAWTTRLGAWGITPASDVVIYDDADGSNAAARAWWMLRSVGHERVRVLDGGFRAAVEAGLGVTADVSTPKATTPYPAAAWQLPTVDMAFVDRARSDAGWKILDVRSTPRFLGDTEPIDPVAGHIPGAVNLPFADNMRNGVFKSPDELRAQYEALLDGTPPDHLVVHCGSGVTACHTLLALEAAGLAGASLYVGSWSEWCRNEKPLGTGP